MDYDRRMQDVRLQNFKSLLIQSRNNKEDLSNLLQTERSFSLLYDAIECRPDFVECMIQFAIENDVDSSILLDSVLGKKLLHAAVRNKNHEIVGQILKYATDHGHQNALLLGPDAEHGETPFQFAITVQDVGSMNAIFRFGVKNGVNALKLLGPNKRGRTALHYAIQKRTGYDVMRAIVTLATDNDIDAAMLFRADKEGKTPLHLASIFNLVNPVIALAKEVGICAKSLISSNRTGNSQLHYAAMKSDVDSVKTFLNYVTDSGVDVVSLFQPNVNRRTPLHCAATNLCHDTFSTLLSWAMENGISLLPLLEPDSNGLTPLHLMASNQTKVVDHAEAATKILQIADNNKQLPVLLGCDRKGRTPLLLAAKRERRCVVDPILKSAAKHGMVQTVLAPDNGGRTPLHHAVGDWPSQNECNYIASVIIQSAVEQGREIAQTILSPDGKGQTPLHLAARIGRRSVVEEIMKLAAEHGMVQIVLAPDHEGQTPVHHAARNVYHYRFKPYMDIIRGILQSAGEHGREIVQTILAPDDQGKTPLHFAVREKSISSVIILSAVEHGKEMLQTILAADGQGKTPLHLALQNWDGLKTAHMIIQKAVEHGKEVVQTILVPDDEGQTPLHLAVRHERKCIVEAILKAASDHGIEIVQTILAPDCAGQTPLHLAARMECIASMIMQSAAGFGQQMVQTILAPDKCGNTALKLGILEFHIWRKDTRTGEAIMRFARKNGVDWKTLIDTKDAALRLNLRGIFNNQIILEPWIWPRLFPSQSR